MINKFLEMFMTCHIKKSINISDYGNILVCGAIYNQNVVLKTFLILNNTIATRQHLLAKSELFGRLWFDPAITSLLFIIAIIALIIFSEWMHSSKAQKIMHHVSFDNSSYCEF